MLNLKSLKKEELNFLSSVESLLKDTTNIEKLINVLDLSLLETGEINKEHLIKELSTLVILKVELVEKLLNEKEIQEELDWNSELKNEIKLVVDKLNRDNIQSIETYLRDLYKEFKDADFIKKELRINNSNIREIKGKAMTIGFLAFIMLILFAFVMQAQFSLMQDRIDNWTVKINNLSNENKNLKDSILTNTKEISSLKDSIKSVESSIENIKDSKKKEVLNWIKLQLELGNISLNDLSSLNDLNKKTDLNKKELKQ